MRKLERDEAEKYFKLIPKDQAEILLDLRNRLVKMAKAEEELIISYQLPTIRVSGKNFLAFAAWKDFIPSTCSVAAWGSSLQMN